MHILSYFHANLGPNFSRFVRPKQTQYDVRRIIKHNQSFYLFGSQFRNEHSTSNYDLVNFPLALLVSYNQ